ncbi:class I SAM-dependent methyltransferase [Calothrix sp. CCY 0018]|uniref:class I SAM-dependent methyltransferase n=1 Tax=Calothrix sp. CCY 0018 TaxID=3103864 RepID=UPI0039C6F4B6
MTEESINLINNQTREAWNATAKVWDERMGDEGNDFYRVLVRPAIEKLLQLKPGQRILDVGCGNGLTTRRLASLGARMLGIDFASEMINNARKRTNYNQELIEYQVLDATDETALLKLCESSFDAAVSAMVLMNMAEIEPLFKALTKLVRPGGCFIFAVMHPCFNSMHTSMAAELIEKENLIYTEYSVKVKAYLKPTKVRGLALENQPQPHTYFHRPLNILLNTAFNAGFVLDGLEEPTFLPELAAENIGIGWSKFSEIPPVIVARLRLL